MKGLWFRDRQARQLVLLGYLPWLAGLNLVWEASHVRLYSTLGDVLIGAAALFVALIAGRKGPPARPVR